MHVDKKLQSLFLCTVQSCFLFWKFHLLVSPFLFFFFFSGFTDLGTTQWLNPCILKKGIRSDAGDMIGEEDGPTGPKAKDRQYKNFDQENSENQEHQDRF